MDSAPTIGEGPHPVSAYERIDLIDVVRGFALFGVLPANLVWITTDVVLTDARLSQLPTARVDRIVDREIVAGGVGLFLLPQVFARFICGLYVGRRNWARRTTELLPTLRRLLPWTIAVGVVGKGTAMLRERLQHTNVLGRDS